MANLTTSGTTSYPGALDSRTALTDGAAGDEILARHPNGLGAAVIAVETELGVDPAGSLTDVAQRLGIALNNDGTLRSTVTTAGPGAVISYAAGVFTIGWSPDGPNYTQNASIELTPNSPVINAMRVRLVQRSGATPTSASPVRLAFRVATITGSVPSASYVVREITGDTQLQLSSGSTLGFLSNELGRFYVWALDTSGTVEVAASRDARFAEGELHSTTAEGGAGGADDRATLYSTTAQSGVPLRCLGYVELQPTTAGNWSVNPTRIQLMGPGVKRTGDVVQVFSTQTSAVATGTTTIPYDDTIPQNTEGVLVLTLPASLSSAVNNAMVEANGHYQEPAGAGQRVISALFRGSEADAIGASAELKDSATEIQLPLTFYLATTTAGSVTYALRAGSTGAGTFTINGTAGARRLGGVMMTTLRITEIMA